jgi:branched-chain amino acid transport system ATP-binding protein
MFEIKALDVFYEENQALFDISISVKQGEVVGIIGSNGSGKSTLLKAIMGLIPSKRGEIWLNEKSIINIPTHVIVSDGITLVPSEKAVYPQMNVSENLVMGTLQYDSKSAAQLAIGEVFKKFPILNERKRQQAGKMSGGEQKLLAIVRGILMNPKLLLIDEPSAGLAPLIISNLYNVLKSIKNSNISILIVEQDTKRVLKFVDRGYLLENGRIVLQGESSFLLKNDYVKKVYLGL